MSMHSRLHRIRMAQGPKEQPAAFMVDDDRAPGRMAAAVGQSAGQPPRQPGDYPHDQVVKQVTAAPAYEPLKLEKVDLEPMLPPCDTEPA